LKDRAAVAVGAQIRLVPEEFVEQVAVGGVQLTASKPAALALRAASA
jgi:hypothetical protein